MIKTVLSAALISGIAAVSFAGSAEARGFGGFHGGGFHGGFHGTGFRGGGFHHFTPFHHRRVFFRHGFRRFSSNDTGGVSTDRLNGPAEYRLGA
ncbi:hypothetical protein [Methylobacterium nodulans]|uniref:Sulfur globule protein n=1 Tax=Methylobacterium nodulans (strain LMG 21967 / CNCM I-2342 / ORS 2060) TaxID=460265 RepID=B8IXW5_METNO|nr:hypothetical protein [Methylobacterium nodulans]ACL63255.1 conserved hypothetical protein [Methylobacterium nodulans ORS 2060]